MTLLKAWAQRSGLVCWLAGEHKEQRITPEKDEFGDWYNRRCSRCYARRLARERKKPTKEGPK